MPRLPIRHCTIRYAGRELLIPNARLSLEDTSLELPWSYGTSTISTVNGRRATITDTGNASGTLTLPIVTDYPTINDAIQALVELRTWADAHTTGSLSLQLTRFDPAGPQQEKEQVYATPRGTEKEQFYWAHIAKPPVVTDPIIYCELDLFTPDPILLFPAYLSIWQQQEDGEWARLATSTTLALYGRTGELASHNFTPGFTLTGRPIRLILSKTLSAGTEWDESLLFNVYVSPIDDDSSINHGGWSTPHIPSIRFYTDGTPFELSYKAAITNLTPTIKLAPGGGYRLLTTWEFILT